MKHGHRWRWRGRWLFALVVGIGAAWGLAGCATPAAVVVTTTLDSHDAAPGDGVCDDGAGRCSLRAALEESNLGSTASDVTVPSGTYALTLGTLSVDPGPRLVTLHAEAPGAVIDAAAAPAGLIVSSGSLTLLGVAVTGTSGAGVQVTGGASIRLIAVSLHHDGVGLQVDGGASAIAWTATIADNTGAGIVNAGSVNASAVTVTGNGAGGITGTGSVTLASSVVADQVTGANCATPASSGGYNLVSDASCVPAVGTDVVNSADAKLGPLTGDPLAARAPQSGSAAIDSIPLASCGPGTDQLARPRPVGVACDRGAVEADFSALSLTVNTSIDANDTNPGDGVCDDGTAHCTLRAAVTETNLRPTTATHSVRLNASPVLSIVPSGPDDITTDDITTGDIDVYTNLTIRGALKTIDGATIDRVFHHHSGHLSLTSPNFLTIKGGVRWGAGATGGGIATDAELTLDHVNMGVNRVTGADAAGGAIYGSATASITIRSSLIQYNVANGNSLEAGMRGGGIAVDGASLSIADSVISANSAGVVNRDTGEGGAVAASGATTTVDRSTISSNRAEGSGGGFRITGGSTTLRDSTIAANTIAAIGYDQNGSAMRLDGPVALVHTTMVDNRRDGADGSTGASSVVGAQWVTFAASVAVPADSMVCDVPAGASGGFNLMADRSCGLTSAGDQHDVNPVLAPLAPNGGPSPTFLPYAGSPAIDAIPTGTPALCDAGAPTDQRGIARPAGGGCDIGAVEGAGPPLVPLNLLVDTPADTNDVAAGDGVCDDGSGKCSLRAAVTEANARATTDSVSIASGVQPVLSIAGADEDANLSGDLDVNDWTVIHGNGATLDAGLVDVAITDHARGLTIDHLTITRGIGALRAIAGSMSVSESALSGNSGPGLTGTSSWMTVTASTISGNQAAADEGAGIVGRGGHLFVRNSTITGNTKSPGSQQIGAAVALRFAGSPGSAGVGELVSVTVTDNAGGDSIAGQATLTGSVLVPAAGTHACAGPMASGGYNVVTDTSCGLAATGDNQGVNPQLAPLAANGGPTLSRLPFASSPAVDVIPSGVAGLCDASNPSDQRGVPRPPGGACDAGSLEGSGAVLVPLHLLVTSAVDAADAVPGDGVCDDGAGRCTLRAAITETNLRSTTDVVEVAPGIDPVLTLAGASEDGNLSGDLDVRDWLTIVGNDATVDAGGLDRAFDVSGPVEVTVEHLTITGGHLVAGDGAGLSSASNLVLDQVSLLANVALTASAKGGGLYARGADTQVTGSTVSGNQTAGGAALEISCVAAVVCAGSVTDSVVSTNQGIGIGSGTSFGSLSIARTRITGNTGSGIQAGSALTVDDSTIDANAGNGIVLQTQNLPVSIANTTITGNAGATTVELAYRYATISHSTITGPVHAISSGLHATVGASIVAGGPGLTCSPTDFFGSGGYNVIADGSCTSGHLMATDRVAEPPALQPLGANGGPTPTRLPYDGAAAIDLVAPGTAGLCDSSTPTDQRGVARPQGGSCDAGATEGSAGPAPPYAATVTSALDTHDASLGDGLCADAGGLCTLRAAVDEANVSPSVATITIAPGINPTLSIGGASDDANVSGDLDVTGYVVLHGNSAIVDAANLDRVMDLFGGSLALDHLTLRGGRVVSPDLTGAGLNVANGGSLSLDSVTITANAIVGTGAGCSGGGLRSRSATVIVSNSTVSNNTVTCDAYFDSGGGVASVGSALTVSNSTISGNRVTLGGKGAGLYVAPQGLGPDGSLHLERSTVSGNTFSSFASTGGGLWMSAAVPGTIDRSTFSGNVAFNGAAIALVGPIGNEVLWPLDVTATTILGNAGSASVASIPYSTYAIEVHLRGTVVSAGSGAACTGAVTSGGYNAATDATCSLTSVGDMASATVQLGVLAVNGGPTKTHLPLAGSPLVDAVPAGTAGLCDGTVPVDQRGLPRPSGAGCDIGSVER